MRYWLMKSEPDTYSIDDLEKDGETSWDGVRNYQARNMMRDLMKIGDRVLFYHSNAKPPGVAGVAEVSSAPHPDTTAWDKKSPYYFEKASPDHPIWMMIAVRFIAKLPKLVSLDEIKKIPACQDMLLLQKGQRLSIQPITKKHFDAIVKKQRPLNCDL